MPDTTPDALAEAAIQSPRRIRARTAQVLFPEP
jgi:hypothetical protein